MKEETYTPDWFSIDHWLIASIYPRSSILSIPDQQEDLGGKT